MYPKTLADPEYLILHNKRANNYHTCGFVQHDILILTNNWKIRVFPKPVGRTANKSVLKSRVNMASCFLFRSQFKRYSQSREIRNIFFEGRIHASQIPHILICVVILPRKNRKKIMLLIDRRWSPHQSEPPSKIWKGFPNEQIVRAGVLLSPSPPLTTISYFPPLTVCNFFDWPQASVSRAISKMSAFSSYQNKNTPTLQANAIFETRLERQKV